MTSPIICSPRFSVTAGFAPPSGLTPTKLPNWWESLQVNHQPSIGMINFSNSWDQKLSIFPFSGVVHFDTHPHENTRGSFWIPHHSHPETAAFYTCFNGNSQLQRDKGLTEGQVVVAVGQLRLCRGQFIHFHLHGFCLLVLLRSWPLVTQS